MILILVLASTPGFPKIPQNEDDEGSIPSIEASTYPVKVLARSNSNRIYLFDDPLSKSPFIGHLILLKNDTQAPVMALRIVKIYPELKRFAAKYLKSYGGTELLNENQTFTAVEKVMDLVSPPTPSIDQNELKEIEEERASLIQKPGSPALETSQPPPPPPVEEPPPPPPPAPPGEEPPLTSQKSDEKEVDGEDLEDENVDSETNSPSVVEIRNLDKYSFWLSAGLGAIISPNPANLTQAQYLSAGNVRFGVTIAHEVFFHRSSLQDSLVAELGVFGYKVIAPAGDTYTQVAAVPTLRYNLTFGEHLSLFAYAGMTRSFVVAAANATAATYNALNSSFPALGAGLLFQIGPGWYTRLDGGIESIALNLLLRF